MRGDFNTKPLGTRGMSSGLEARRPGRKLTIKRG